ncbi:MAG: ABC transporter permease subunit [Myxococcaceae bacterium]|nr:ABC transporter permease subunit [Myxococcaceae bacterium]
MTAALLIARRELAAYLRTWSGYVIIAAMLLLDGLLFNAFAMGGSSKRSAEVIYQFFYFSSGVTITAAVFLSMRLLAEERQTGTLSLLYSSPVTDAEIVIGKFLSALAFLSILIVLTLYMPLLVLVNGKVSFGHLFAGYLGLLLLGAASVAIGTFGSSLAKNQVLAAILSGVIVVALLVCWMLSSVTDRPFSELFTALALHGKHFQPFGQGIVHVRDVIYYVAVTFVALFAAIRVLEARRWR